MERKRHIGNDIVIIVFQDWDDSPFFSPPAIKSKFVRILFNLEKEYLLYPCLARWIGIVQWARLSLLGVVGNIILSFNEPIKKMQLGCITTGKLSKYGIITSLIPGVSPDRQLLNEAEQNIAIFQWSRG